MQRTLQFTIKLQELHAKRIKAIIDTAIATINDKANAAQLKFMRRSHVNAVPEKKLFQHIEKITHPLPRGVVLTTPEKELLYNCILTGEADTTKWQAWGMRFIPHASGMASIEFMGNVRVELESMDKGFPYCDLLHALFWLEGDLLTFELVVTVKRKDTQFVTNVAANDPV